MKKASKSVVVFIIITFIILICPVVTSAATAKVLQMNNTYGEEFEYIILENGKIEITRYNGNEIEVEIPQLIDGYEVERINDAFCFNKEIVSVTFPDNIVKIGRFCTLSG